MADAMPVADARRILVYGVTGSGKSTLAAGLAARTGIPWHSMDDLTWRPGWVPAPVEEQRGVVAGICAGERWIIDSAYGSWLDIVLARVELVVGLDYPRWFSLQRLLRRTLLRSIDRRPICNGNVETLRTAFTRDSIIRWHFQSYARKRDRIRAWQADPAAPPVARLRTARDTRRWLAAAGAHPA